MTPTTALLLILGGAVAIWLACLLIDAYYDAADERARDEADAAHAAEVWRAYEANRNAKWRD